MLLGSSKLAWLEQGHDEVEKLLQPHSEVITAAILPCMKAGCEEFCQSFSNQFLSIGKAMPIADLVEREI